MSLLYLSDCWFAGVRLVGYHVNDYQQEHIVELIREQTKGFLIMNEYWSSPTLIKTHITCVFISGYKREQDRKAQITKQTKELHRLPSWPPNSPELNLIEIVWSWMVEDICRREGGWPKNLEDLKQAIIEAWDNVSIESFRELVRSYKHRLFAIQSVQGGRHPQFS